MTDEPVTLEQLFNDGFFVQVTLIFPHSAGSEEERTFLEAAFQMNVNHGLAKLDPSHEEPRRRIGMWHPIWATTPENCCDLGPDSEREPPTICEKCKDSWELDWLVAVFTHGTLRGVAYGCTCSLCDLVVSPLHPGDNMPLTLDDIPTGGPGTYPGE